eukprot:COSAG01_NODE_1747_length_9331_cov_5.997509_8_plen_113_part_00
MDMLQFSCVRGLSTVHSKLEQKGALALLADPNLPTATMEILPEGKSRQQVQVRLPLPLLLLQSVCSTSQAPCRHGAPPPPPLSHSLCTLTHSFTGDTTMMHRRWRSSVRRPL